jgi:phosphomannomutase
MGKIKFGTDGWRGVIGDDFTFNNVRRVAAAVARYVMTEGEPARGLLIGYDTRFLSAECAQAAAEVVAAAGIPVILADRATPPRRSRTAASRPSGADAGIPPSP